MDTIEAISGPGARKTPTTRRSTTFTDRRMTKSRHLRRPPPKARPKKIPQRQKERYLSKTPAKKLIPLLLLTFTMAGVIGFIYETVCVLINTGGEFFKRGTTYGPWIPIYGFGALMIYALTVKFRKKPWLVFLIAMTSCGLLELVSGYVIDKFFHQRLWDYSTVILNWGNLNGYICVRSVLTWGIFGMLLMYGLLPLEEKFQKKLPKAFNIVTFALFGLFALDIVLSLTIK